MPHLHRRRARELPAIELTQHTVGYALVIGTGDMTSEAQSLALSLVDDPEHDLVVVDLPVDCPISVWDAVATELRRGSRGVRIMLCGWSRQATALVGQWLSERLNRMIVVPDGAVVQGAGGTLFVNSGWNTGWVRFQPGHAPQWEAKRFPRPSWESLAIAELSLISSATAAELLPAGVWIRSRDHEESLAQSRPRLVDSLPCQPEILSIVLGSPGTPPLAIEDVTRFCMMLPDDIRPKVRFVEYGPIMLPAGGTFGQRMADQLGSEVVCYTGMPVGPANCPDVFTVRPDGVLGWNTFAQQVAYQSQNRGNPAAAPGLRAYRRPVPGLTEIAPAVYEYAPDVVLEVVQSGLWVRPPYEVANAATIRATPADPVEQLIVFEAADAEQAGRMRMVGEHVFDQFDQPTRSISRLISASTVRTARISVAGRALLAEMELSALDGFEPTSDIPHPMADSPPTGPATTESLNAGAASAVSMEAFAPT